MSYLDRFGLRPYDEVEDKRVVLLQSGGLDSLVLTALFHRLGYEIQHLFIDYEHCSAIRDRKNAKKIIAEYGGDYHEAKIEMPWLHLYGSDEMEYVPVRNSILIGLAWSLCEHLDYPYVATALIGQENPITHRPNSAYDVHNTFARKISEGLNEGSRRYHTTGDRIELLTPLMGYYKENVISLGEILDVDFSLSNSCLSKGYKPCGKCKPCKARALAFEHENMKDPLLAYTY